MDLQRYKKKCIYTSENNFFCNNSRHICLIGTFYDLFFSLNRDMDLDIWINLSNFARK